MATSGDLSWPPVDTFSWPRTAVHPSPVSLVDSLRNQLVSRDCWVWLFSASVLGTQCGCFRSAFTSVANVTAFVNLDKSEIGRRTGRVRPPTLERIDDGLRKVLGL